MALRIGTNVPEQARLLSLEGVLTPSSFGDDQLCFKTDKGQLYVSQAVGGILADHIAKHNVKAGDTVEIAKREVSLGNGRKGIRWELTKVAPIVGEQPNGTFAVPAPPATDIERKLAESIDRAQAQRAQSSVAPPAAMTAWNEMLVSQTAALYDAYVAALEAAQAKHGGFVKPEDVRALLTTCYINATKGVTSRVA